MLLDSDDKKYQSSMTYRIGLLVSTLIQCTGESSLLIQGYAIRMCLMDSCAEEPPAPGFVQARGNPNDCSYKMSSL